MAPTIKALYRSLTVYLVLRIKFCPEIHGYKLDLQAVALPQLVPICGGCGFTANQLDVQKIIIGGTGFGATL